MWQDDLNLGLLNPSRNFNSLAHFIEFEFDIELMNVPAS